jgi:hypothetical protein
MTDTPPIPPRATRRFGCLSILLLLLTIALLSVAGMIWLARSEPAQWREVNDAIAAVPPAEQEKRAVSLEQRLVGESQGLDSKKGPVITRTTDLAAPVERSISISVTDANIWLATRLEGTLAQSKQAMPKIMSEPRVWIEDGQIVLSARVKLPVAGIEGVVSFPLETAMQPDGKVMLKVAKVRTGKLRVPSGVIADQVRDELKDAQAGIARQIGDAFDGVAIDPVFPDAGDKNRQTRVLDFQVHPDKVDMRLRNEAKPKGTK